MLKNKKTSVIYLASDLNKTSSINISDVNYDDNNFLLYIGKRSGYKNFNREVKCGKSRFDFKLEFSNIKAFVEVKSVSLVEGGVGKFPDAPTQRGVKHLKELIDLRRQGYRAAVIFVSQRSDARSIISNDEIDPLFGESLRKAHLASVELYAYNCSVTKNTVSIKDQIPVNI